MLEARAIIVRLEGSDAILEPRQGSGCGHCSREGGCGTQTLSKLLGDRTRHFRLHNEIDAHPGEEVGIAIADGLLLRSTFILYGVPLFALLTGAMLGQSYRGDLWAALGALGGLVLGLVLARMLSARQIARPGILMRMTRAPAASCTSSD